MRTPQQSAGDWPTLAASATPAEIAARIADGNDIDATDTFGRTAILIASKARRFEVVRDLIAAGADIDAQDQTRLNPLLWGCISNDLELVEIMLAAGADITRTTRFDGAPIHPAAEKGHLEIVQLLLRDTDVNVNHTNICGWTPLLEAVILGDGGSRQQEIVRLLIAAGADVSMTDQWGVSPLEHAQKLGFTELAAILAA